MVRSFHGATVAVALILSPTLVLAYDTEWPPRPDPPFCGWTSPPEVQMGSVAWNFPAELASWFDHSHEATPYPMAIAVGDIEGEDDGDLGLVCYMSNEVLAGFSVDVDWAQNPPALQLTWLWGWLSPYALRPSTSPLGGLDGMAPSPNAITPGWGAAPVVIFDLDEDGTNEIIFVYDDDPETRHVNNFFEKEGVHRSVYVMQTDLNANPAAGHFPNIPLPATLATFQHQHNGAWLNPRVGIGRLRNDGWDIINQGHQGNVLTVLRLNGSAATGYTLDAPYYRREACALASHEFNWADVDGDGFDEFMLGGVVDFVDADANGQPIPANSAVPHSGIRRWDFMDSTSPGVCSKWHMDMIVAADLDKGRTGLEVLGVPQSNIGGPWTDVLTGVPGGTHTHAEAYPIQADENGVFLREHVDSASSECQFFMVGNWSGELAGGTPNDLEVIYFPKGRPGELLEDLPYGAVYNLAQDAFGTNLASDGSIDLDPSQSGIQFPTGGPVVGLTLQQIDWNGDYDQDEILNQTDLCAYVWRMGRKGDTPQGVVGPNGLPAGMPPFDPTNPGQFPSDPSCNGVTNAPQEWPWYANHPTIADPNWPWFYGMAGPFSHYYEKLGEYNPVPAQPSGEHAWFEWKATGYDMGADYREEIVAVTPYDVRLLYNLDVWGEPCRHPTPVAYDEYRLSKVNIGAHFDYWAQPTLERIEISPKTLGMHLDSWEQLTAIGHYSDGSTHDITHTVTWVGDPQMDAFITAYPGGRVKSQVWETSARIWAGTMVNGEVVKSNYSYVYTAPHTNPTVLSAGYQDTFLEVGQGAPLMVEARVAQIDNEPLYPILCDSQGTPWIYNGSYVFLYDDGTNGDPEAGDGVYHALVNPGPLPPDINAGDNLFTIKGVRWDPIAGVVYGDPWPHYIVNNTVTYPQLGVQSTDPPYVESNMPKIKSCGLRGQNVWPGYVLLEAEVIPPASGAAVTEVWALLPGGVSMQMTRVDPQENLYILSTILPTVPASGSHIIDVFAVTDAGFASDLWPRLLAH